MTNTKKRLPIAIQTFAKIRDKKENNIYVDKTQTIIDFINNNRNAFLSRPRRFGKSLMLDTIKELFEGNKALFEGLYAENHWDWETTYPVIKLDFTCISGQGDTEEVARLIKDDLRSVGEYHEIDNSLFEDESPAKMFAYLLEELYHKTSKPIVFLVDEYDYPLVHNLNDMAVAKQVRKLLGDFYAVLKKYSTYMHYVLITGVSKFVKLSLFSQANQLTDMTLEPVSSTICGYTHQEVLDNFGDYLQDVKMDVVKSWYNGYNYLGEAIYNPFDVLLYLHKKRFENYWWETGSSTVLKHLIETNDNLYLPNFENTSYPIEVLNAFDIEEMSLIALLWQSGNLTFDYTVGDDEEGTLEYKMKYPNMEVQRSINRLFFKMLTNDPLGGHKARDLKSALLTFDGEVIKNNLNQLFASFPYTSYTKNNIKTAEGYYQNILYTCFRMLPTYRVYTELMTHNGRVDSVLVGKEAIFVLEYKVNETAQEGLAQIYERQYHKRYIGDPRPIYLLSIEFDKVTALVKEVVIERFVG